MENVYGGVGEWAKWTQTLAVVEVGNSALGGLLLFFLVPLAIEIPSRPELGKEGGWVAR